MQWLVPGYLENAMRSFARNQEQMRRTMQEAFGGIFPFAVPFEQMSKQNISMIEQAMKLWAPFSPPQPGAPASGDPQADAIADLKRQVDVLQRQLNALNDKPK